MTSIEERTDTIHTRLSEQEKSESMHQRNEKIAMMPCIHGTLELGYYHGCIEQREEDIKKAIQIMRREVAYNGNGAVMDEEFIEYFVKELEGDQ